MIFTYNREYVGDTLMVLVKEVKNAKRTVERKGNVARIYLEETGETLAWNIFSLSSLLNIAERGQVFLTDDQVAVLNAELGKEGFSERLVSDVGPKFVVAQIKEVIAHPDSDHLHICQVEICDNQVVQIVCGASNATKGLKTIAALPGAMMPNGSFIFSGQLRGEESFGMLCSARELELPNAPQVRGIIELTADAEVGAPFDVAKHWHF